jgi:hypothetical protein
VVEPVVEVVDVFVVDEGEVVTLEVVVVLPEVVVVVVLVDVDVEPQDDNNRDIASKQLKIKKTVFTLILSPFFILSLSESNCHGHVYCVKMYHISHQFVK